MTLRLVLTAFVAAMLAGCATEVGTPRMIGEDRYEVSYYAGWNPQSWVEIKNTTIRAATDYCADQQLKLVRPETVSNRATGVVPKRATTRFSCAPIDPETAAEAAYN